MVRHLAVGIDLDFVLDSVPAKPLEIGPVVPRSPECRFSVIAPNDDMIEQTWSKNPRSPCHEYSIGTTTVLFNHFV